MQQKATSTAPAYHLPVMLSESVEGLNIRADGVYVDLTYGGGGHSKHILSRLNKDGRLIGFDRDADASTNLPDDPRHTLVQHNFSHLSRFLEYLGIEEVHGILADLGVSSHQFDEGKRGFSYRFDAPLDMRMDWQGTLTAALVVNSYPQPHLEQIFRLYGELPQARKMSDLICNRRIHSPINTTGQLKEAISEAVPKYNEYPVWSKVFQALRIVVNAELEALEAVLPQAEKALKPGGRLVVISYHSLEDRLVKNFIKTGNVSGVTETDSYGVKKGRLKQIGKMRMPNPAETEKNNRARSAKLRVAEKTG